MHAGMILADVSDGTHITMTVGGETAVEALGEIDATETQTADMMTVAAETGAGAGIDTGATVEETAAETVAGIATGRTIIARKDDVVTRGLPPSTFSFYCVCSNEMTNICRRLRNVGWIFSPPSMA
jgi:hypothetical protein